MMYIGENERVSHTNPPPHSVSQTPPVHQPIIHLKAHLNHTGNCNYKPIKHTTMKTNSQTKARVINATPYFIEEKNLGIIVLTFDTPVPTLVWSGREFVKGVKTTLSFNADTLRDAIAKSSCNADCLFSIFKTKPSLRMASNIAEMVKDSEMTITEPFDIGTVKVVNYIESINLREDIKKDVDEAFLKLMERMYF